MSTLRANTLKPITSGNSLVLQGDSGGSGVSGPSIDSNGDVDFSQNTNAKVKLPSGGGIYESDGSTPVLTESGGSVTIQNATFNGTVGNSAVINGVTDGSDAADGNVGEEIEVTMTGVTIDTSYDSMGNITLTAGDWDLFLNAYYSGAGGNAYMQVGLGTTEDSVSGTVDGKSFMTIDVNNTVGVGQGSFQFRVSVTSSTIYYVNARLAAGSGTYFYGYLLARRRR